MHSMNTQTRRSLHERRIGPAEGTCVNSISMSPGRTLRIHAFRHSTEQITTKCQRNELSRTSYGVSWSRANGVRKHDIQATCAHGTARHGTLRFFSFIEQNIRSVPGDVIKRSSVSHGFHLWSRTPRVRLKASQAHNRGTVITKTTALRRLRG